MPLNDYVTKAEVPTSMADCAARVVKFGEIATEAAAAFVAARDRWHEARSDLDQAWRDYVDARERQDDATPYTTPGPVPAR